MTPSLTDASLGGARYANRRAPSVEELKGDREDRSPRSRFTPRPTIIAEGVVVGRLTPINLPADTESATTTHSNNRNNSSNKSKESCGSHSPTAIRTSASTAALTAAVTAAAAAALSAGADEDLSHPPANDEDIDYGTSFGFSPVPSIKTNRHKSFGAGVLHSARK